MGIPNSFYMLIDPVGLLVVDEKHPSKIQDSQSKEDSQFTLNKRPKRSCRLKITNEESPKSPGK